MRQTNEVQLAVLQKDKTLCKQETKMAIGLMISLLFMQTVIWFPFLPNQVGRLSGDFSLWLPNALAGYFWHLKNNPFVMPWFSPAECAGVPFHADPQGAYLSVFQLLVFVMRPTSAVRVLFVIYAALGYWGAWHLTRRTFRFSQQASLLSASLFMLNGFYCVRMVVGHLTYASFMLLPFLCASVLRPPAMGPTSRSETLLRVCLGGLIIASCIQAGMIHILPPMILSVAMIGIIHAMRFGSLGGTLARLTASVLIGTALCAGKLAASISLLSNFPRDQYPLPGIQGVFGVIYVALRGLLTPVSGGLGEWIVNSRFLEEQHEFEYGVSCVPALLGLAAAVYLLRRRHLLRLRILTLLFISMLLVPLALNLYSPSWNGWLKDLPFFGSSSNLLRWFSAYILVAIIGCAVSLDLVTGERQHWRTPIAAAGIVTMLVTSAWSDHAIYGPRGEGVYDPSALDAAWSSARAAGVPPSILEVVELYSNGQVAMSPERQNGLSQGFSTLHCYNPLFGYRLERFPLERTTLGSSLAIHDSAVNIKNPACYVFPAANNCKPGDQFPAERISDARAFVSYEPFPFSKPTYARVADYLGIISLLAVLLVVARTWWRLNLAETVRATARWIRSVGLDALDSLEQGRQVLAPKVLPIYRLASSPSGLRVLPAFIVAALFIVLASIRLGGFQETYQAILWDWGINPFPRTFIDTNHLISGITCHRNGINVYHANPCDALGRIFDYPPFLFALSHLPVTMAWTVPAGLFFCVIFILALLLLPPTSNLVGALLVTAGATSTAVVFGLERGNTDLLVFALAAACAALVSRRGPVGYLGYAAVLLAALAKYFPMALLFIAVRERFTRMICIVSTFGAFVLVAVVIEWGNLPKALSHVPTGSHFGDMFGSETLPGGLADLYGMSPSWAFFVRATMTIAAVVASYRLGCSTTLRNSTMAVEARAGIFLVLGSSMLVVCFLTAQNVGYRALQLMLVLPTFVALANSCRDRGWRLIFRGCVAAVIFLLWSEGIRRWLAEMTGSGGQSIGRTLTDLDFWRFRELVWWALMIALGAILTSEVRHSLAMQQLAVRIRSAGGVLRRVDVF